MKGIGGYLKIEWWSENYTEFKSESTTALCGEYQSVKQPKPNEQNIDQVSENDINKNVKFICKYYLLIDKYSNYDKNFQLARRVIGPKGINMRHIWDNCNVGQDTVKLRLRG